MVARRDVLAGEADDLAIFERGLVAADRCEGQLMPQADPLPDRERAAVMLHLQAGRQITSGDRQIVLRTQVHRDVEQGHGRHVNSRFRVKQTLCIAPPCPASTVPGSRQIGSRTGGIV